MYIKIDENKISTTQLIELKKLLKVSELERIHNIHHEVCRYEIECVIDNAMDYNTAERFKEENEELIEEWIDELYHRANYQWDCLYEKAEEIVDLELED